MRGRTRWSLLNVPRVIRLVPRLLAEVLCDMARSAFAQHREDRRTALVWSRLRALAEAVREEARGVSASAIPPGATPGCSAWDALCFSAGLADMVDLEEDGAEVGAMALRLAAALPEHERALLAMEAEAYSDWWHDTARDDAHDLLPGDAVELAADAIMEAARALADADWRRSLEDPAE